MSCKHCENHEPIYSGEGRFSIGKPTVMMRDGKCRVEPIMRYYAIDSVFTYDVKIDDHIAINYCPMCGADLTEGL